MLVPTRITDKINKDTESGCWLWRGGTGARGRPFASFGGKPYYVHIRLYEMLIGPVPKGLILRHTCDNILCVNPEHLLPGTRKDNMHDLFNRGNSHKRLSQEDVDKLRNAEVSVIELSVKYSMSIKYLNNILYGWKRQIRWAK